jgi:hypothetical protein
MRHSEQLQNSLLLTRGELYSISHTHPTMKLLLPPKAMKKWIFSCLHCTGCFEEPDPDFFFKVLYTTIVALSLWRLL